MQFYPHRGLSITSLGTSFAPNMEGPMQKGFLNLILKNILNNFFSGKRRCPCPSRALFPSLCSAPVHHPRRPFPWILLLGQFLDTQRAHFLGDVRHCSRSHFKFGLHGRKVSFLMCWGNYSRKLNIHSA